MFAAGQMCDFMFVVADLDIDLDDLLPILILQLMKHSFSGRQTQQTFCAFAWKLEG